MITEMVGLTGQVCGGMLDTLVHGQYGEITTVRESPLLIYGRQILQNRHVSVGDAKTLSITEGPGKVKRFLEMEVAL